MFQCQSLTRWNRFIFQYNGSAGSENLGAEPYFVRIKSYTDRGIGSWTHRRSSLQHRRSSVHGRRRCPHHSPSPTCPSLAAPAPTSWPPPPLPSALASRRLAGRLPSLAWREDRSRFFFNVFLPERTEVDGCEWPEGNEAGLGGTVAVAVGGDRLVGSGIGPIWWGRRDSRMKER